MVQFDNQAKQVRLKVVYYGPAQGGKTTCLQHIHRVTDPTRRTKLYALNTASDRTLFFDLLSLDLGRVRGYRVTLQLFTVPGQVQYGTTRRAVLAGADAVVLVADSRRGQSGANQESLRDLSENLRANGIDPSATPLVLQYNKRDLPGVSSREEMDAALNPGGKPAFETVATEGRGVIEAFAAVVEMMVTSVAERLGLSGDPGEIAALSATVRTAFQPLLPRAEFPPAEPAVVIRPAEASEQLDQEGLIAEAVRANMAMTELSARLDRLAADLDLRVRQLGAANEFGRLMSLAREPAEIAANLLERLLADLRAAGGSLLLLNDRGELVEVLRKGIAAEPVMSADGDGRPAALALLGSRQSLIVRLDDLAEEQVAAAPWLDAVRELGVVAALVVPLVAQDRAMGLVTCYADAARGAFEDADLDLATVLGATGAVALANARAWLTLDQLNRSLEATVSARTRELQETLAHTRALAEQLEERNVALEVANRELRELERLKGDLLRRVAHELNTPVTAIQTAASILGRYGEIPQERVARFVSIIGQESARLGELIASAIQAAVLGVPDGAATASPVDLQALLRTVVAPLRGEIETRRIRIQVRVAAGLAGVRGDPEQLEAALRAAVRNAVEFSPDGGAIELTVRPVRRGRSSWMEIRVEDQGQGIPAEHLPHVTEVFWQGGDLMTSKPRGLGLGLAVARRVADNHGGRLEIASEPGKGTVVTFLLPLADEPAAGGQ
jgi:signal transduction histidine kinase/signal recognition particle receptor subunit beta